MATLVYSDVDGIDRSFSLGPDPVMVGRAAECAIRSEDPRVSRMHARIFFDQGSVWVEDLGSSNGIFVGPQRVQRAAVPVGEIVLVGSLLIRLLPPSGGTLPPPIGLHGTLAQWLEMERKARSAVEDERNAFARRVGELHEELRTLREAHGVTEQEAVALRAEMAEVQKDTQGALEAMRVDLAKAREAKMIAETQAGITTAERLAEADMMISGLQHKVAQLEKAAAAAPPAKPVLDESKNVELAAAIARVEKAEKDLGAAQIRAQGAERNLAGATSQAAKAETRAAELDGKLADAVAARQAAEAEVAALREKVAALDARQGAAVDAPLAAAEARAQKLAAELADMTQQFETRRDRMVELEGSATAARDEAKAAKVEAAAQTEKVAAADKARADAEAKVREAEGKVREAEARVAALGSAGAEIEAARKASEEAKARTQSADARIAEVLARAEDNEKSARARPTRWPRRWRRTSPRRSSARSTPMRERGRSRASSTVPTSAPTRRARRPRSVRRRQRRPRSARRRPTRRSPRSRPRRWRSSRRCRRISAASSRRRRRSSRRRPSSSRRISAPGSSRLSASWRPSARRR